ALFWTMTPRGREGWRRYVALHAPDVARPELRFLCPTLKPLSLAAGADVNQALLGDWDGSIYSCDLSEPAAIPVRLARQSDGGVIALASSLDARYLISQSAFHSYGWDLATHRQLWRRDNVAPYCFSIRPHSARAILGTLDVDLIEIDLASVKTLRTIARCHSQVLIMTLSIGGQHAAFFSANVVLLLI